MLCLLCIRYTLHIMPSYSISQDHFWSHLQWKLCWACGFFTCQSVSLIILRSTSKFYTQLLQWSHKFLLFHLWEWSCLRFSVCLLLSWVTNETLVFTLFLVYLLLTVLKKSKYTSWKYLELVRWLENYPVINIDHMVGFQASAKNVNNYFWSASNAHQVRY